MAVPISKRILRGVGRAAIRSIDLVLRPLPLPMALAFGRGLGNFSRMIFKKKYAVALKNLRIAYGDSITDAERTRLARASFTNWGMFAVELLKFPNMPQAEVDRRIHVDGPSFARMEELMSHKKGCLLITGHIGNMEITSRWIVPKGYDLIALVRAARDKGTTEMMTKAREKCGVKVVALGQSLKPILVGLKKNALVAIICDQNATDVFVPFFGHPTGTVDGPARMAIRMGTPMLFYCCTRDGKGSYHSEMIDVLWPEPTGDEKADVERIMTEVNRNLEIMIRKYPEQWLWFHDRWRSSPGVAPAPKN